MARKPLLTAAFVFVLLSGIMYVLVSYRLKLSTEQQKEGLIRELNTVKDRFRNLLYNDITAANTLAIIYKQQGTDNFDSVASDILKNCPYVQAVQITENGVIKKVYPLEGHENTIGVNLQNDSLRNAEASRALEKKGIYFAGPRALREGGVGILGKVPIVINGQTKAIAVVLTGLPTIIRSLELSDSTNNIYAYTLTKNHAADSASYPLSGARPNKQSEAVSVVIPEGDWQLHVAYSDKYSKTNYPYELAVIGLLLSFITALLVYRKMIESVSLERTVREKTSELSRKNRNLEQFNYIISHNVRGPLATILSLNSLLKEEHLDELLAFLVDGIGNSADKLDGVLKDLNEILHIRNDSSEAKQEVSLHQETEIVKKNIATLIDSSKAVIECDFTAVNSIVTVKSYLYSICFNLLTNAIKFAKPGISPHIKIWSEKRGDKMWICFRDNGMGLDTHRYADRIFGLYQRFHPHIEGKGLGLFMTKTQVEVLNGKIELESKLGVGTTFRLSFPL